MTSFKIHTPESAPAESREILKGLQGKLGFVPNAIAEMAESPALLKGWWGISEAAKLGKFSPVETYLVQLEVSRLNDCGYCIAASTMLGEKEGVARDILNAIREDKPLKEPKLQALREFVRAVMKRMGRVEDRDVEAFIKAGYSQAHVMEVVLHAASKFITNYVNHIARTPLDKPLEAFRAEERRAVGKEAGRSAA